MDGNMRCFQYNMFSPHFFVALFVLIVNVTAQFYDKISDQYTDHYTMCSDPSTVDVTGPGIILSPGYINDRNYPSNMNCKIQLRIPQNKYLKISFSSFKLEKSTDCSHDRLIISRQTREGLSKINQFCGSEKPASIIVEGPSIVIQFVSDHIIEFNGFELFYTLSEDEGDIETDLSCPKRKILNVIKSGIIVSPGFEIGRYPPNKNCEYILRIPANRILQITFSSFSLEGSKVCHDSLTIYRKTSSLHQIGKWCGNKKPNDIFVKGPEIVIRFKSNQQIERRGFRLQYSITEQHSQGCGKRQAAFQSNVYKGKAVSSPQKWPWIVSLHQGKRYFCAGAILNEKWILTAAHCIQNMYHILWLMLRAGNSKKSNSATFEVSEVYRHAKYKTYFTDDIALIRVKTPLTISDTIRPICFKDFDKKSFQNCYTAGWGMRGPGKKHSHDLQEAKVDIWDDDSCKKHWKGKYRITSICARANGTACKGDSGSPLMCSDPSGSRWSVVGVTSFGKSCGHPRNVPVYMNVSAYSDWIQQIMNTYPESHQKCSLAYPSLCNVYTSLRKSNQSDELPEFFCDFNNGNTCNYKLKSVAKWTVQKDPLDITNSYLFILNLNRIETIIDSPRFNMTGSVCFSFIYKIQSRNKATISIFLDTISFGKKFLWISKATGRWEKLQIIINDPPISKFSLVLFSVKKADYFIDNISLIKGNCQQR